MNQLKVNQQQSILALRQQGWSKRRIARELGLDRATVRKYLAAAGAKITHRPASRLRRGEPFKFTHPAHRLGGLCAPKITRQPATRLGGSQRTGQLL